MSQYHNTFSSKDIHPTSISYDSAASRHGDVELFVQTTSPQGSVKLQQAAFDEGQKSLQLGDSHRPVTPELCAQIDKLLAQHRQIFRTAEGQEKTGSVSLNKILTTSFSSVIAGPVAFYPNSHSFPRDIGERLSAYEKRIGSRFPNLPQNEVKALLDAARLQAMQRGQLL